MKKILLFSLALFLITCSAVAQNGWLPPVTFSSNSNICDNTSWKLVFYDDFNGSYIDTTKWFTFNTNNGGTSADWCEGRLPYPGNYSIIRDTNAVVSDGTLKLKLNQQTNTWQCETCNTSHCTSGYGNHPVTRNYTSGYISSKTTFDNGKFEARLRLPTFNHSWATCWLWALNYVNEIDFAEMQTPGSLAFNLHAHAPNPNPYNLPNSTDYGTYFPPSSYYWWWHLLTGQTFNPGDWHTYTCQWDTAKIIASIDDSYQMTVWKYYKIQENRRTFFGGFFHGFNWTYTVNVASGCQPTPGVKYYVTKGFPFNNNSNSKLIFSIAVTDSNKMLSQDGELGQIEIDYVKVWQRHPEMDNHSNICEDSLSQPPVVSGPDILCTNGTYTAAPTVQGGAVGCVIWCCNT